MTLPRIIPDIRLRPAWHVGVPFVLGAFMVGVIGFAAGNILACAFAALLVAWGGWWAQQAHRGRGAFHAAIIATAAALPAPDMTHAVWLGPATLKVRPRRTGHLYWALQGFLWSEQPPRPGAGLKVPLEALPDPLTLAFATLEQLTHVSRALSGDQLVVMDRRGDTTRFGLPNPAVWTLANLALQRHMQRNGTAGPIENA